MKKSKKLLTLFLSLAMVLALAACGGDTSTDETTDDATTEETGDGEATGLKIAIITTSGVDDGSFNQNCYEGIQAFLADHADCEVSHIQEPDYNKLVPTVEQMAGSYDVFVLPGFMYLCDGIVRRTTLHANFLTSKEVKSHE